MFTTYYVTISYRFFKQYMPVFMPRDNHNDFNNDYGFLKLPGTDAEGLKFRELLETK